MTISSQTRKAGPFRGNGASTAFPFNFKVFGKTDIKVLKVDSNGISTTLALDSDYSVLLNPNQDSGPGGQIAYPVTGAPLPTGYQLVIVGDLPYDQGTDITNGGGFYPKVISDMVDRATIQIQQLEEITSRAIVVSEAESLNPVLPTAQARAGTVLSFDALGNLTLLPIPAGVGAGDLQDEIGNDGKPGFVAGVDFIAGATAQLTLSRAPGNKANVWIEFDGVYQGGDQILSLVGTTLTLTAPIPLGTQRVYVRTGTTLSVYVPPDQSVTDSKVAPGSLLYNRVHDALSLRDKGAVGDGSNDDTAAVEAVEASAVDTIFVPEGTYSASTASASLTKNYFGFGQLKTSANRRAKFFSAIHAAPATLGDHDSIETAFNGDVTHSIFQSEHRITGAATLGQPTTGYVYTPETYQEYVRLYNSSGWNNGTSDNSGRTAAVAKRIALEQYGQGDCVAYNATAFVSGARAGATSFLANPAASLWNGDMTAGSSGVYLNPYETFLSDGGFDVAGIGSVSNLERTNATGALFAWWGGYRVQSVGSAKIDVAFSAIGGARFGLDLSYLQLDATQSAIALSANQRIYGNVTATDPDARYPIVSGDWFGYQSSISGWVFQIANNNVLQMNGNQVTVPTRFQHTGTSLGFFGGSPVGQPGAISQTAGFNAGAGTAMNSASTSTGGIGANVYTFGDVVRALKLLNLIAN
ncbi:hypothetical protein VSR69_42585 [Paraburkholderia phytofirmans]|uniref:hypothetical protein n=1 Tax=Paraburkholderia sp. BL9I2N2 TaxID=1938809 RepID=UPI00104BC85F|nr:hypothetical protein [Paraburkholderia sp. BL9I2N2]TCK94127.1 hypothetical protein B0G74_0663 [Paraburkholderia sp. BL9I2N2]